MPRVSLHSVLQTLPVGSSYEESLKIMPQAEKWLTKEKERLEQMYAFQESFWPINSGAGCDEVGRGLRCAADDLYHSGCCAAKEDQEAGRGSTVKHHEISAYGSDFTFSLSGLVCCALASCNCALIDSLCLGSSPALMTVSTQ